MEEQEARREELAERFYSIGNFISDFGARINEKELTGLEKLADQIISGLDYNSTDISTISGYKYRCGHNHAFKFDISEQVFTPRGFGLTYQDCIALQKCNESGHCPICIIIDRFADNREKIEYCDVDQITIDRKHYQFKCSEGHLFGLDITKFNVCPDVCPICVLIKWANSQKDYDFKYEAGCHTGKNSLLIFSCKKCDSMFYLTEYELMNCKKTIKCGFHDNFISARARWALSILGEYIGSNIYSDNMLIQEGVGYDNEILFYSSKARVAFIIDDYNESNNNVESRKLQKFCLTRRPKINIYFIIRKNTIKRSIMKKFIETTLIKTGLLKTWPSIESGPEIKK